MSTWKQTISPSWISLTRNVAFIFISSIIFGLISCDSRERQYSRRDWMDGGTNLVDLERCVGKEAHSLVDHEREVEYSHVTVHIEVSDTAERLVGDVEVLDEDHDRGFLSVSDGPLQREDVRSSASIMQYEGHTWALRAGSMYSR